MRISKTRRIIPVETAFVFLSHSFTQLFPMEWGFTKDSWDEEAFKSSRFTETTLNFMPRILGLSLYFTLFCLSFCVCVCECLCVPLVSSSVCITPSFLSYAYYFFVFVTLPQASTWRVQSRLFSCFFLVLATSTRISIRHQYRGFPISIFLW